MSDEKNNKSPSMKSLFNQAREIDKREQQEKEKKHLEAVKKQQEEEEKQREEYASKLYQDKINILKEKSDGENYFDDNSEENQKKHYTLKQKISNFFYHNKWWLGIGCFLVCLAAYIIYDVATNVKPDMTVMLVANDEQLYERTAELQELFGNYVGDRNNDGNVKINIIYMPISDYVYQSQPEVYVSSTTGLASMLQSYESMIVIADEQSSETFEEDELLFSLEKYFPDNQNVKDTGFYPAGTDLADAIGYEGDDFADDLYIGIRKVSKGASYEEKMREEFNLDFEVLKDIINDFSD